MTMKRLLEDKGEHKPPFLSFKETLRHSLEDDFMWCPNASRLE